MITVKRIGEKWRLMDDLDEVAVNLTSGRPLDGGGHQEEDKALRQAGYINAAYQKKQDTLNAKKTENG